MHPAVIKVFYFVYLYYLVSFFTMCVLLSYMNLVSGFLTKVSIRKVLRPATSALFFFWFPCVYKQMLRWFSTLRVATTCFSCSPPDFNLLDPYFIFMYMHNNHCHWGTAHLQLNVLLLLLLLLLLHDNCF